MESQVITTPDGLHLVNGMMFKHKARALLDSDEATKSGIDLDGIVSPYTIWEKMPPDKGIVFTDPNSEELRKNPLYIKLKANPASVEIDVFYNN